MLNELSDRIPAKGNQLGDVIILIISAAVDKSVFYPINSYKYIFSIAQWVFSTNLYISSALSSSVSKSGNIVTRFLSELGRDSESSFTTDLKIFKLHFAKSA